MSTVKTYNLDTGDTTSLAIKTNGTTAITVNGTTQATTVGNAETSATPTNGLVQATGGSGTNITGATLTIQGGRGTGTGAGGPVIISTAAAGSSGTTLNAASERMRVTPAGLVGIGVTPAGTGLLELKAGTTTVAPLEFNSGSNLTTAVAGVVEYDGKVFYATPLGTQRGVLPGAQFFRLDSGLAGANATGAQNIFGVGVTLSGSTVYAFEGVFALSKSAGATSHTISLGYGGTATINNISYQTLGGLNNTSAAVVAGSNNALAQFITTASNTAISGAIAVATYHATVQVKGVVSVNAGGTFIPTYALSAAPGGAYTTTAGSYFLIYPIGASGANTSVGTWA